MLISATYLRYSVVTQYDLRKTLQKELNNNANNTIPRCSSTKHKTKHEH